ncbi:hypothetical protein GLOTRDRAFT_111120, partial [Gloeophyllum trabeum ATCC 11539]
RNSNSGSEQGSFGTDGPFPKCLPRLSRTPVSHWPWLLQVVGVRSSPQPVLHRDQVSSDIQAHFRDFRLQCCFP